MEVSEEEIGSWFSNYEAKHGSIKNFADLYTLGQSIQTEMPIGSLGSFILAKWLTNFYIDEQNKTIVNSEKTLNNVGDSVNYPTHYTNGDIECIDAIQASMSSEEFKGYLKGNVLKYIWRYRDKNNPSEDLKKAEWYLHKLIDQVDDVLSESEA